MAEFVGMRLADARDLASALDGVAAEAAQRANRLNQLTRDLDGGSTALRLSDIGGWAAGESKDIRWRADELEAMDARNDGYAHATFPWKTFADYQEDFQLGQRDAAQLAEVLTAQSDGLTPKDFADAIRGLKGSGRAYTDGFFDRLGPNGAARLSATVRTDAKLHGALDAALAGYLSSPKHRAAYGDFDRARDLAVANAVAERLAKELTDPKHMRPSWSDVQRLLDYLRSIKDDPAATAAFFNGLGGKKAALLPLFIVAGWAGQEGKRDVGEVQAAIDLVRQDLATASQTVGKPGGLKADVVHDMFSVNVPDVASFKRPAGDHITAVDVNKALQAAGFGQEFVDVAAGALGAQRAATAAELFGGLIVSAGVVNAIAIGAEKGFDSPQFAFAATQAGLDVAAFAVGGLGGALILGLSLFVGLIGTIGPCEDCPKPATYATDATPPGDPTTINSAGFAHDPQGFGI